MMFLDRTERFRQEADCFVGLVVDRALCAVGDYYLDFFQVVDEEVIAMLAEAQERIPSSRFS